MARRNSCSSYDTDEDVPCLDDIEDPAGTKGLLDGWDEYRSNSFLHALFARTRSLRPSTDTKESSAGYLLSVAVLAIMLYIVSSFQRLTLTVTEVPTEGSLEKLTSAWSVDRPGTISQFTSWEASIWTADGTRLCSGSLVEPNLILTVAKCVTGRYGETADVETLQVVFEGEGDDGSVPHQVSQIEVHPLYNPLSNENDIAVLLLEKASQNQPIEIDTTLTDVSELPTSRVSFGVGSRTVESVSLENRSSCQMELSTRGSLSELLLASGMICSFNEFADSNALNFGGSVITSSTGRPKLVALTSWAYSPGKRNGYFIYTRVASYRCWLQDHMSQPIGHHYPSECQGRRWSPSEGENHFGFSIVDLLKMTRTSPARSGDHASALPPQGSAQSIGTVADEVRPEFPEMGNPCRENAYWIYIECKTSVRESCLADYSSILNECRSNSEN